MSDDRNPTNADSQSATDNEQSPQLTELLARGPAIIFVLQAADLLVGCGEVIQRLAQAGQDVFPIVIELDPDGHAPEAGSASVPPPEWAEEAIAAHRIAKQSPVYWRGLRRGCLYSEYSIARIEALLAAVKPSVAYGPRTDHQQSEYLALALAVREAVRRGSTPCTLVCYSAVSIPPDEDGGLDAAETSGTIGCRAFAVQRKADLGADASLPLHLSFAEHYSVIPPTALIHPVQELWRRRTFGGCCGPDAPLVSVVTRTTNRAELADTLDSIAGQTYGNIEVLLVDALGASAIASVVRCGPFPIKLIATGERLNRGAAANAGLAAASGSYVLFLDDDDWLHPDHLESLVSTLRDTREVGAAYSQTACLTLAEDDSWRNTYIYDANYDKARLLTENFLPIHSVLFERRLTDAGVRFDESLEVYEDWDFWLQLSQLTDFAPTHRLTAIYRLSEGSGFGQRRGDQAAVDGYRLIMEKWRERWSGDELVGIARDAAAQRRCGDGIGETLPKSPLTEAGAAAGENDAEHRVIAEAQQARIAVLERTIATQRITLDTRAQDLNGVQLELDQVRRQQQASQRGLHELEHIRNDLLARLDRIQTSPYWQLTSPVRRIDARWPRTTNAIAAAAKLAWWSLTLRLAGRLKIRQQTHRILVSGLFVREWYVRNYPDVVLRGLNPILHWVSGGWREGRWPNELFDTAWYAQENPEIAASGVNPLIHFLDRAVEDCPDPNPLFHVHWYLREYPQVRKLGTNPLVHYLTSGARAGCDPNPLFDSSWYLEQNPDVAAAGANPLAHFIHRGALEGRDPHPWFDVDWYLAQNPDVARSGLNPLVHYFWAGAAEGRAPCTGFDPAAYIARHPEAARAGVNPLVHFLAGRRSKTVPELATKAAGNAKEGRFQACYQAMSEQARPRPQAGTFVADLGEEVGPPTAPVRVIAFYLPQFHPIPENDEWWGKGFTEWTNVSKAVPQFVGHYQPRLPGALGFYDLRVKEVQREQIALAKRYGVYGFCYHHYWFAGRRLLERPLQQMLDDRSLDFPFCICWANENWTRRWDGCEDDVLLGQQHSLEDDLAFIAELEPALRDPRYIRVDGRPLLIVYRPQLFPDPVATAEHWRDYARRRGFPEPYLVNVWSFPEAIDPRSIGFDAAVEFPPHQYPCAEKTTELELLNPGFAGRVCDYRACVEHAEDLQYRSGPFRLFPGVMTAWDNTPRRLEHGTVYVNATPEAYQRWLYTAAERALDVAQADQRLVFVNAWNEWAEGTYLEPDRRYGYAYLSATRQALEALAREQAMESGVGDIELPVGRRQRVLLVGHDAHAHGAQLLALNLARLWCRRCGFEVRIWLLEGGGLVSDYAEVGRVDLIGERIGEISTAVRALRSEGFDLAVTNTVVTAAVLPVLKREGFTILSLVHEMPALIRERGLEAAAATVVAHADRIVFAAETVRSAFATIAPMPPEKSRLVPQGIYQVLESPWDARAAVERRLGLPPDAVVVMNAGYGDARKGFDWFLECARYLADSDPRYHFVWVGKLTPDFERRYQSERRVGRMVTNLHQLPFTDKISEYYAAADVFLLTSREDPFPSVILEALACGLPVVAFQGSGGHCEIVQEMPLLGALAAPLGDVHALAEAVRRVVAADNADRDQRTRRARWARARFDFARYGWRLLYELRPTLRSVSVVIPNFNYARYLPERLKSVFDQTYPVYEVIVLDDASTDDSCRVVDRISEACGRRVRLVANAENSGSVFKQWSKAIHEAQGQLVWIAEADDVARPEFLERMVAAVNSQDDLVFAFSDSEQVDGDGHRLGESYAEYCNEYSGVDFSAGFTLPTEQFLAKGIGVKNTILNVSAVLFVRERLIEALTKVEAELRDWRIAGDWRLYLELCKSGGKVAYTAERLNVHRRHGRSVVGANRLPAHIDEIARMHRLIGAERLTDSELIARQRAYLHTLTLRASSEGEKALLNC